ncbi:tRNA (adenosine(37)-N6)-threonylcarbamoyltransferase complex ATPase subunit type 1 TsaE, partial [bacterium]|nr:tRNA (adenosine(37)-N6)-threonylcarbamoyltransferase complex ATPase subunit type 1 TsaE [bacterium]
TEPITSPTYTYVNVYRLNGITFYHFDLYRLNSLDDFIQAGFDEYLYQPDSYCFIEWPEIIEKLIEKDLCKVIIDYDTEDSRFVVVKKYE